MSGLYGIPFRAPANGWLSVSSAPTLGSIFNQQNNQLFSTSQAIYNNVIQYPTGSAGNPYTRGIGVACGTPSACPDETDGACPHETWVGCDHVYQYSSVQPVPTASGYTSASLFNPTQCHTIGYKNVQAKKFWQGTAGWNNADYWNCPDTYEACTDSNGNLPYTLPTSPGQLPVDNPVRWNPTWSTWRAVHDTPSQNKYCSVSYNGSLSYTELVNNYSCSYDMTGSMTGCVVTDTWTYRQLDASGNFNVSIDPVSGFTDNNSISVTQTCTVRPQSGSYLYTVNNTDGSPFATVDLNDTFTYAEWNGATGQMQFQAYDGIYFDQYGNPHYGYGTAGVDIPSIAIRLYPTNDMVFTDDFGCNPYCSTDAPTVGNVVTFWNMLIGYNPDFSGSLIIVPPVTVNGWSTSQSYVIDYLDNAYTNTININVTKSETVYSASISMNVTYYSDSSGAPMNNAILTYNFDAILGSPYTASAVQADLDTLTNYYPLDNDAIYPWRTDGNASIAPIISRNEYPNSPLQAWHGPINDLRSPIIDVYYNAPFSTASTPGQHGEPINDSHGNVPFSPQWTASYSAPVDWVPTYNLMPYFDPDTSCFYWTGTGSSANAAAAGITILYDGSVLGKPAYSSSSAGTIVYTNNFDFYKKVYDYDSCPDSGTYQWFIQGAGEFCNGQYGTPACATQITNLYDAQYLPYGAFTLPAEGYVFRQKWAEIKLNTPSYDFNRPYGFDLYLPDQGACCCNPSFDGTSNVTLYNYDSSYFNPVPTASVGDTWGGTAVGGFYTINGISGDGSGSPYVLSLTLPSSSTMPADFDEPFCRLRFPTAPPVGLTSVGITWDGTSSYVNCSSQLPLFYTASIDLYGSTINSSGTIVPLQSAAYTGVTVYQTSPTQVTSSANLTGAKFMISSGLQPWWCDNQPKGQAITCTWLSDPRINGENNRLIGVTDCTGSAITTGSYNNRYASFTSGSLNVHTSHCGYSVMSFSNNGETWPSASYSYVSSIPSIVIDQTYPNSWNGEIIQTVTDLIWQKPHPTCGFIGTWTQDNGSCQMDAEDGTVAYYPYPDQIEPFLSLPTTVLLDSSTSTAPDPASKGFSWQILSPVVTSSGLPPPAPNGFSIPGGVPNGWVFPWTVATNFCNTADCRFSGSYGQWISC